MVIRPQLTTAQRDALVSPTMGLVIYNTDTDVYDFYNGTVWAAIGGEEGPVTELAIQGNVSGGGSGLVTLKSKSASVDISDAPGGEQVIPVSLPSNIRILAIQIINNTEVTGTISTDYDVTFSSSIGVGNIRDGFPFDEGATDSMFSSEDGTPFMNSDQTPGSLNVVITGNGGGSLDTGIVSAIVYYYELTDIEL